MDQVQSHRVGASHRTSDPLLFDAVLSPHRSLSDAGRRLVMVLALAAAAGLGGCFLVMGAWPVVGFFGLDLAALYVALRVSARRGRAHERVRLTERLLTVVRVSPAGAAREWHFQPYWLRVEIEGAVPHERHVVLASHGRRLIVGAFLSPFERIDFADALRSALARLRGIGATA